MTDAEKAALKWLEEMAAIPMGYVPVHARTLKALLAQPRLPAEPTAGMLRAMFGSGHVTDRDIYRALYAELTAPKTKTVEVWHVEYVLRGVPQIRVCGDERTAKGYLLPHEDFQCIRVTGPHKHEVPNA